MMWSNFFSSSFESKSNNWFGQNRAWTKTPVPNYLLWIPCQWGVKLFYLCCFTCLSINTLKWCWFGSLFFTQGVVMLPKMFVTDFGDQIGSYVTLVDTNFNQFEVLVERINRSIFLTTGFNAIRDFYDIRRGCGFWRSSLAQASLALTSSTGLVCLLHLLHSILLCVLRLKSLLL